MYVRFEYGPQIIYKHTQGNVLVSMNSDPVNPMNISQKSTKTYFTNNLKDILYQSNQFIYANKY